MKKALIALCAVVVALAVVCGVLASKNGNLNADLKSITDKLGITEKTLADSQSESQTRAGQIESLTADVTAKADELTAALAGNEALSAQVADLQAAAETAAATAAAHSSSAMPNAVTPIPEPRSI